MPRLIALPNVIAWSGFWAFGCRTLTGEGYSPTQPRIAASVATAGGCIGVLNHLRRVWMSGRSGSAMSSNRMTKDARDATQAHWRAEVSGASTKVKGA